MPVTGSQVAPMVALAGYGRAAEFRANGTTAAPYVSIAGVHYAQARSTTSKKVLAETVTITETNDGASNECSFDCMGFEPTIAQDVIITLGSKNNLDRQFAGIITAVASKYTDTPANALYTVTCSDYTWSLTRRRVIKRYTGQSATAVAKDLIAMAPGFTSNAVQLDLPTIDEISFTFDTVLSALQQVAKRVGASLKVDYLKDVMLATSNTRDSNPVTIQSGTRTFRDLSVSRDLTPVVTRAIDQGGGVNTLAAAAAGDTLLPVESTAWYNDAGGMVVCGPQAITYTGVQDGGGGTLVGPGVTPSAAPSIAPAAGSGIDDGVHQWAFTFVTGAGETLASPVGTMTVGAPTAPSVAPSVFPTGSNDASTDLSNGDSVVYAYSYSTATSINDTSLESALSPTTTITAVIDPGIGVVSAPSVYMTGTTDTRVKWLRVWKNVNGAGYKLAAIYPSSAKGVANPGATSALAVDSGVFATTFSAATMNQASLTGVAVGPSGTTSRKVYRTVAGGSQLKLVATIANNTATTYTDSTADASLGANAPGSDTSGLTQPSGQILAGSTSILVAGAGAFDTNGGIAVIGNGQQAVRYTGISGNSLTGIPSSGAGSIVATIAYNSTITAAPCLTGIPASGDGAILYSIAKGDPVDVLAEVDDLTAQATMGSLFGGGDDGVIEDYAADGRISEVESIARATAKLALTRSERVSIAGLSWDNSFRAGRTATVNITNPTTLSDTFPIQRVTISNFQPAAFPWRQFQASATHFGVADLFKLRKA